MAVKRKKAKKAKTAKKRKAVAPRKAKKTKKARSAKRSVAKKAKRPAAKAKKTKAKKSRNSRDVIGEGNYTASRNFDKAEASYVRSHPDRIKRDAKAAERAIDGPEGADLEAAREETAAHGAE